MDLVEICRARIENLSELFSYSSVNDEGYEQWSRIRLDRLLVDHMIRNGMMEAGEALAKEKGIEKLVDISIFKQCRNIEQSLLNKSTTECLAWCAENRSALKKMEVSLN